MSESWQEFGEQHLSVHGIPPERSLKQAACCDPPIFRIYSPALRLRLFLPRAMSAINVFSRSSRRDAVLHTVPSGV